MSRVNRSLVERIMNTDLRDVRQAAVQVIDSVQVLRPEEQIAGLGVLFLMLCDRFDLPPRRALEAASNMLLGARYRDETHFEALRLYLHHELKE